MTPTRTNPHLRAMEADDSESGESEEPAPAQQPAPLVLPFVPRGRKRKGVAHAPSDDAPTLEPAARDALLKAIARSRRWVGAVFSGDATFDAIAARENLAVRHVRRLAPLAFLAPAVVEAIADSFAPAGLTVTRLAEALPFSWSEQARRLSTL